MSYETENVKTSKFDIPVWHKLNLTIEEAAAYSNIGINKLRDLTNDESCPFVLHVSANKRLIKRKAFEKFIDNSYSL